VPLKELWERPKDFELPHCLLLDREKRELYLCRTDHTTLLFALTEPEDGRVSEANGRQGHHSQLSEVRSTRVYILRTSRGPFGGVLESPECVGWCTYSLRVSYSGRIRWLR
jgi:hypothetical protein